MRITAEISLYPLQEEFVPKIQEFILALRAQGDLEVVSNQLSTQVRGEFDSVTGAINHCMRTSMEQEGTAVFVVKYLNADLPIATAPNIGSSASVGAASSRDSLRRNVIRGWKPLLRELAIANAEIMSTFAGSPCIARKTSV